MTEKLEYSAADMASAAASGWRDGQRAAAEAAQSAQAGEREAFEVEIPDISAIYDGRSFIPYRSLEAGERLMTVAQHLRIEKQLRAALTRPAQTEQPPVAWIVPDFGFLFPTQEAASRYLKNIEDPREPRAVYAAPITQTAQPALVAGKAFNEVCRMLGGRWPDAKLEQEAPTAYRFFMELIDAAQDHPEVQGECGCCGRSDRCDDDCDARMAAAQDQPEVQRLREALGGMLEYFPEGASDGECFAVDAARAAIATSTGAGGAK